MLVLCSIECWAAAMHTPDGDAGPLEGAAAGSWSLGIVEQSCSLWSRAELEIKPQWKPRGGVAKQEDPSLSTSCTICRLSPRDQLGKLCDYGIYKRLRAPTKENKLGLIAVDIGGKNAEE